MARGILCKETHDFVIRLAPPLTIDEEDIRIALSTIGELLSD